MGKVFVGTSGWVYPHWRGLFYPKDLPEREWLGFYAFQLDTVELNTSFYHLPKEKTFKGWYERTPDNFLFAVKGSRFITHMKKLNDCQEPLENLLRAAVNLKEKLGPIFFQFPPSFKADLKRLKEFIKLLPGEGRFAFEFRHPSWFTDEIYTALRSANCALIASDTPRYPYKEVQTTNFMYLRLHGHEQLYASRYSEKQLREYAKKIRNWRKEGNVFVFFDNDFNANAVANAKELRKLLNC